MTPGTIFWMWVPPFALVMSALALALAGAQSPRADTSAVYLSKAADRDQRLVEAARKEGTLTFYTSMQTPESGPLSQAFTKKYGIKIQLWRAGSEQVLQRAVAEARGGRNSLDLVETNAPELEAMAREEVIAEFHSPHLADLPDWAIPPHRRWFSDRSNLWVVGYNTNKVKREEIPATYAGFAEAKWKGRIALEASDQDWMYGVIQFMGQERGLEFFRKLAALKPELRSGHALLGELVAAGEVPVALTAYSGNIESVKKRGAPADWVAVEPLVGRPQAVGLAKNAPHPNAALLFADFILSPEGQKLLNDLDRVPSSKTQTTLLTKYKHVMIDPIKWIDEAPKWEQLWRELLGK